MVDRKIFDDTYRIFDKSLIVEIIGIFIHEWPGRFENLERNIREADFKKLRFNAHSLKGVVSGFAAPLVYEKVKNLEISALSLIDSGGEGFRESELLADLGKIAEMIFEMIDDLKVIQSAYQ